MLYKSNLRRHKINMHAKELNLSRMKECDICGKAVHIARMAIHCRMHQSKALVTAIAPVTSMCCHFCIYLFVTVIASFKRNITIGFNFWLSLLICRLSLYALLIQKCMRHNTFLHICMLDRKQFLL